MHLCQTTFSLLSPNFSFRAQRMAEVSPGQTNKQENEPVGDEGFARIEALDTMLFILTDPPPKIHCQDVLVHIQLFLCLARFFRLRILPTGTPHKNDGK